MRRLNIRRSAFIRFPADGGRPKGPQQGGLRHGGLSRVIPPMEMGKQLVLEHLAAEIYEAVIYRIETSEVGMIDGLLSVFGGRAEVDYHVDFVLG